MSKSKENVYTLFEGDCVYIFGHRGFSEMYPENTMASFRACAENEHVNGIELDIHLCNSGEGVVCHDYSLKRVSGKDVIVENTDYDDLLKVDVGKGEHVPLLEDLFEEFGDRFIYDIELKVPAGKINRKLCLSAWDLVCKYNLGSNVVFSSFNPLALRRLNQCSWYSVPTADIFSQDKEVPKFLQNGFGHFFSGSSYLKPNYKLVTDSFLDKKNMFVIPWTVNTEEEACRLAEKPAVRGLIGNNPEILYQAVKKTAESRIYFPSNC